jgi:adenylyltransferase/sulfurtransferase
MLKRYSRNIALAQIGQDGQEALLDASVLVIGAGGLGSPVMLYLAAAGVGTIGVADSDRVEISNLQRQILYSNSSIGKSKVDEAAAAVLSLNPEIRVIKHKVRFGGASHPLFGREGEGLLQNNSQAASPHPDPVQKGEEIIARYDIIADCSDNFATRFIINDECFNYKKTLVSGAVTGFVGQVASFKAHLGGQNPCYRCFCPELPPEELLPNCSSGGVLGSVAGVIGSMQATEIIKEILGIGTSISGTIIIYDGLSCKTRHVSLKKKSDCSTCSLI